MKTSIRVVMSGELRQAVMDKSAKAGVDMSTWIRSVLADHLRKPALARSASKVVGRPRKEIAELSVK